MKILVLLILASLAFAAPAMAKPADPQVVALKKQVAALKAEMTILQQQITANKNIALCDYALSQDSFRIVFTAMSKITLALTGSNIPAWEQIPRFDDRGACTAVGVPRP